MNSEWFEKVIKEQIKTCEDVLIGKAKEYATDDDRLHNFKNAAGMMSCDPKEALAGMMAKHTISVYDMCRSGKDYPIELWNEKITDHINYLLLLKAVVTEEKSLDQARTAKRIAENSIYGFTSAVFARALEKIQNDPHIRHEAAPGMTLMGNQLSTDEELHGDLAKRTDDVIRSLRICSGNDGCDGCKYRDDFAGDCVDMLRLEAVELLEIARDPEYEKKKSKDQTSDSEDEKKKYLEEVRNLYKDACACISANCDQCSRDIPGHVWPTCELQLLCDLGRALNLDKEIENLPMGSYKPAGTKEEHNDNT